MCVALCGKVAFFWYPVSGCEAGYSMATFDLAQHVVVVDKGDVNRFMLVSPTSFDVSFFVDEGF